MRNHMHSQRVIRIFVISVIIDNHESPSSGAGANEENLGIFGEMYPNSRHLLGTRTKHANTASANRIKFASFEKETLKLRRFTCVFIESRNSLMTVIPALPVKESISTEGMRVKCERTELGDFEEENLKSRRFYSSIC